MTTATATPRRRRARLPAIDWLWVALVIMLIGYWIFAWSLERVNGNVILARFFLPDLTPAQAQSATFSPFFRVLVELFNWRVLRHLIPVIVGWWLAVQAAVSLMQVLYHCPDRKTAADFLRRQRRRGVGAAEQPWTIQPDNLDEARGSSILLRVGGPVRVLIPAGYAAVTERNARFLRVLSPGIHDLGHFEYLLGVVELEPQRRKADDVPLLTKDGIQVKTDISIVFTMDPGDDPVSAARPQPFRPEAIRRAAYSGTVDGNGKVSSWDGGALGKVRGALAAEVAAYPLDELIAAESPHDAHHLLVETVTDKVWAALPKDGIRPLQVNIGRLTPPPEVSQQYTNFWLAGQHKLDSLARADTNAPLLQEFESARANGEILMIRAILEGMRRAEQEASGPVSMQILAVRLLEALRQMFRYTVMGLEATGGQSGQLVAEVDAVTSRLSGLEDQIRSSQSRLSSSRSDSHPSRPDFNPSSPD